MIAGSRFSKYQIVLMYETLCMTVLYNNGLGTECIYNFIHTFGHLWDVCQNSRIRMVSLQPLPFFHLTANSPSFLLIPII